MRLRSLGASLAVLGLVGASIIIPAGVASAVPPSAVDITGTIGSASVDNPRIGLSGTWEVPTGSPPVTSVQVRHSTDPTFATSSPWCNANVTDLSPAPSPWSCIAGMGGMLEHGPNYFQATATNAHGQLTSTIFTSGGLNLNRTPRVTVPGSNIITNETMLTVSGVAYPNTTLEVRTDLAPLCPSVTVAANGAWSCTVDVSTYAELNHTLQVEDLGYTASTLVSAPRQIRLDFTAPGAPTIGAPTDGLRTTDPTVTASGFGEPGATVTATASPGGTSCVSLVDGGGAWSCDVGLAPGTQQIHAYQTDPAGNDSTSPPPITVTALAPTVVGSPASGSSLANAQPVVSGSAEPGAAIEVQFWGPANQTCATVAGVGGTFSCAPPAPLVLGGYQVIAVNTDDALSSGPVSITIVEANPTITAPTTGSTVADSRPTISGGHFGDDVTSILVEHSPDGLTFTAFCTDNAPTAGTWGCTPASPELSVGSNILRASAFVGATQVDQSAPATITLAAATVIGSPSPSSQLGNSQPTVSGTAHPGANVTVQFWGPTTATCSTVANAVTGSFQCAPAAPLAPGGYQIIAENTDIALSSGPLSLTIVDAAPTISAPAPASTGQARPTVTGSYLGDDVDTVMVLLSTDGGSNYSVYCVDTAPTGTFSCASTTTDLAIGSNIFAAEAYVGATLVATGPNYTVTRVAPPAPPTPPAPTRAPQPPTPITWSFTLDAVGPVGPGTAVTVSASGLPAGSAVTIELHSTPRTLGSTSVGPDGALRYSAVIPRDAEPGDHSLVLTLTPPGGVASTVSQPLVVEAPPPAEPEAPEPEEPEPAANPDDEGQDAGGPTTVFRGALPETPRSDPAAPTSLTESVPTAMEVVLSPVSVLTAGGMALALLILVALPTEILNTTISANSRRFGRAFTWFDDATTRASEWLGRVFRTTAVPALLLVALTAIVFTFADPSVGFDAASLRLFASLGIALFIVTWVASRISEVILEKRFGIQSNLLLNPAALVFAVIGVVVARLLDFSPGFLIGLVIGLDLAANIAEKSRIRAIVVQYSVILGLSVAAWLGYSLMVLIQAKGPTGWVTAFVHDTLVAVVAEGLTAIAVAMLPLGFLDGKEVFDYSKKLWAGMFVVIGTAFALLVLPNELNGAEVSDLGLWAIVLLGYAGVTMAIWLILKVTAKYDDDATIENQRVGN